jgi:hypothetical protein
VFFDSDNTNKNTSISTVLVDHFDTSSCIRLNEHIETADDICSDDMIN